MNNLREESGRILKLIKQLNESSTDEELQIQIIENGLKRQYVDGRMDQLAEITEALK